MPSNSASPNRTHTASSVSAEHTESPQPHEQAKRETSQRPDHGRRSSQELGSTPDPDPDLDPDIALGPDQGQAQAQAQAQGQSPVIEEPLPDEPSDMPTTLAASIVLEQLTPNVHRALEHAGGLDREKVTVHFKTLPGTPSLRQPRFKISSTQRFEAVVRFLRRKLAVGDHESVFCYINQVFAPGLDEGVGNLWRCFKTGDELVVNYGITQAFG